MPISVSPSDYDIDVALRSIMSGMLASTVPVIKGQVNRAPEPPNTDFVVFWPLRRRRIETNVDAFGDVTFTASIAGTTMTVSSIQRGTIVVGAQVFGTGVADGTTVVAQAGGTGGTGDYTVTPTQIAASQAMASGGSTFLQPTEITYQVDVHGPSSGNNAQVISTLMRDAYAVDRFAALNSNIYPLLADDPKQVPFTNEQQQYEDRWVVEVLLQVNQTVSGVPQQFADIVTVTLVDTQAQYPA